MNEYSTNKEFTNYLLYILNKDDVNIEIREIAGLSLKGLMERSFVNLTEDAIEYFKKNILTCYFHENNHIRKTISNLINTFIRHGGAEMWPELLDFLYENLDSDIGVGMSLETINIIVEDSGPYIEDKHYKVK
jgi:hypothetical protein